jgi:hypothetical protein
VAGDGGEAEAQELEFKLQLAALEFPSGLPSARRLRLEESLTVEDKLQLVAAA